MMMRGPKWFVRLGVCVGLVALVGGYLGALHSLGDSLAVFRIWAAGAVLAAALILALLRDNAFAIMAGAAAILSGAPILGAMSVSASGAARVDVTVYVKNLGSASADIGGLLGDIVESHADILLLQEVSIANAATLQARLTDHPYQPGANDHSDPQYRPSD